MHEVAEAVEKAKITGAPLTLDEAQDLFRDSYAEHVNRYCETTPDFGLWFKSGRYAGDVDVERRYLIGLEQVENFFDWRHTVPEEVVWIAPDGTPGIELEFDIDLDGVQIRGFIDLVYEALGDVIVRDYKTGNKPGDSFQLGVYAVALAETYGIEPPRLGDYWMGKTGQPVGPFDLTEWSRQRVSAAFRELEDNIRAGRFDPDPEPSKCRFCDVSHACDFSAV